MRSKIIKCTLITGTIVAVLATAALLTLAVTGTEIPIRPGGAESGVSTAVYLEPGKTDKTLNFRDNLIRFHVVANSDSEKDQALKRKVRDLIVQRMTPELAKVKTVGEARVVVRARLDEIRSIAENEVRNHGERYPVKAMIGNYDFPVKSYGNLTLPAGNYEAVRVVIGRGQGANWWCVLFPPLCFVDVSKGMRSDGLDGMAVVSYPGPGGELSVSGTAKNDLLIDPGTKQETVKVRFKVVEMLNRLLD